MPAPCTPRQLALLVEAHRAFVARKRAEAAAAAAAVAAREAAAQADFIAWAEYTAAILDWRILCGLSDSDIE